MYNINKQYYVNLYILRGWRRVTKLGTVEVWLIADYKEGGGSLYEKANI